MVKTNFIVTGVVSCKNKILLLKRSPTAKTYPNKWSFCSGYPKEFESAEDAVLREIFEETGLKCRIKKTGKPVIVFDKKINRIWIIAVYLCEANNDKIKISDENADFEWVKRGEIKKYDLVPGLAKDLKSLGF